MKIICFSKIGDTIQMVLKGDSSLLVNRKPFFIPDWSTDVRMTPCVVLRVSRLGKNIGSRFANRYYDSMALGVNIIAADYVAQGDWVRGFAFDYSLPVGEFAPIEQPIEGLVLDIDTAVEIASKVMTIRQGDLIVVDRDIAARVLLPEEVIREEKDGKEVLYCKIK
ncbi:MAG: hypothetical protein IKB81_05465 [Paludibacteraceae bacterium]|nr:hypothetical protein [Paludibacteraceae bacterium]